MKAIADHLVSSKYDLVFLQVALKLNIIKNKRINIFINAIKINHNHFDRNSKSLQEVFDQSDQNDMINRTQAVYPHAVVIFGK